MRSREYEQALQELGALREAGKVSQEYYDVTRAKMLAESTRPRSWLLSAVTVVAIFRATRRPHPARVRRFRLTIRR